MSVAGYTPMGQLGQGLLGGLGGISSNMMGIATTTNDPWPYWNTVYQTQIATAAINVISYGTAGVTNTVNYVWQSWNQQLTDEQRADIARTEQQLRQEYANEQLRIAGARTKAQELLLRLLSPEQRATWQRSKFFIVQAAIGRCKSYRYQLSETSPPKRLSADGSQFDVSYCIHTQGVPREDELLGFKLLIEANEAAFLKTANATRISEPVREEVRRAA